MLNEEKLKEYKSRKWFACQIDSGFIASANSFKELLAKFGRSSAKYVRTGEYEFYEKSEHYAKTIYVYKGFMLAKFDGYDINDDEHNDWYINEQTED